MLHGRMRLFCDTLLTFTCPREVSIIHYPLGAMLWVLRIATFAYFLYNARANVNWLEKVSVARANLTFRPAPWPPII